MQRRSSLLVALALAATSVPFLPAASADDAAVTVPLAAEGDAWEERFHGFFRYEDDLGRLFREETFENGTGAHGAAGVAEDAYGDDHSVHAAERSVEGVRIYEARYDDSYYSFREDADVEETAAVDLLTRDVIALRSNERVEQDHPGVWNVAPGVRFTLPVGSHSVRERQTDYWALFGRDLVHEGVQGRTLHEGDAWEYTTTLNYLDFSHDVTLYFLVTALDQAADPARASVALRAHPLAEPFREVVFEDGFPLFVEEETSEVFVGNSTDWETNETFGYRYEYGHSMVRTPLAVGATALPFGACINPVHYHARNPHAAFFALGTEGPEDPSGVLPESVHDLLAEAEASDDPDLAEYQAWKESHDDAWVYSAFFHSSGSGFLGTDLLGGPWVFLRVGLAAADGTGFELDRQRSGAFTFPPQDETSWNAYAHDGVPTLTPEQRAGIELVSIDELAAAAAQRGFEGEVEYFSFYVYANAHVHATNETSIIAYAQMTIGFSEREDLQLSDDLTHGPIMSEYRSAVVSVDALRGARIVASSGDSTYYPLAPMPPEEWLPQP